mgnify:CR=1 FL=1
MDMVLAGTIVIVTLAILFGGGWIVNLITRNKKNVPKV